MSMEAYFYSIISVVIVGLISLVGVFALSLREDLLRKYVSVLVSLAVGALIADAFVHLIPEAFAEISNTRNVSLLIIAGIFIFFILEKALHWHHHDSECKNPHPIGKLILVSDGVHNFIDGVIIGASYLVSIPIGLSTTIAIILHEIPQEIGDFGVLIHAGYSRRRALWWNFISALFAALGLLVVFLFGSFIQTLALWFLPLTAGGFIYIALSDLIPELRKTKSPVYSIWQFAAILVGVGSMILLLGLE